MIRSVWFLLFVPLTTANSQLENRPRRDFLPWTKLSLIGRSVSGYGVKPYQNRNRSVAVPARINFRLQKTPGILKAHCRQNVAVAGDGHTPQFETTWLGKHPISTSTLFGFNIVE